MICQFPARRSPGDRPKSDHIRDCLNAPHELIALLLLLKSQQRKMVIAMACDFMPALMDGAHRLWIAVDGLTRNEKGRDDRMVIQKIEERF